MRLRSSFAEAAIRHNTGFGKIVTYLCYVLVAYIVVLVLARVLEGRMIFFPDYPSRLEGDWHPRTLGPEDVWLTAADGTKLHSWWIPAVGAKLTFLALHGNASNIANRAPTYEFLHEMSVNVLALEYRGYGRSEGTPSEAGIYRDAEAAYEYLVNTKGVDPKSIVIFGQSLGTAVASHLAARRAAGGVVLEAPFPSASRVASRLYWFLPGLSLMVRGQFDTLANLRNVSAPVMVVHCTEDPVIPFEFGEEVYQAAHSPKIFLRIEGDCHEEASLIAPERYHAALRDFLMQVVAPQ